MRIKRIHHLALAVRDLDAARLTFEQLFDVQGDRPVDVPVFGIRSQDIPLGDSVLQLATPVDVDNPLLRFLERKGEGFYNLALEVDDLDAAVRELTGQGVRVSEPVDSQPGMRSAFVTMSATHGLSIQLIEITVAAPPTTFARPAETPEHAPQADEQPPIEAPAPAPPIDLTPDEWSDTD